VGNVWVFFMVQVSTNRYTFSNGDTPQALEVYLWRPFSVLQNQDRRRDKIGTIAS
jgi:hypothetical protein